MGETIYRDISHVYTQPLEGFIMKFFIPMLFLILSGCKSEEIKKVDIAWCAEDCLFNYVRESDEPLGSSVQPIINICKQKFEEKGCCKKYGRVFECY